MLTTAERTKTFRHQWFGDINGLPRFHGDSSWKKICKGVWTSWFDWKEVLMTCVITCKFRELCTEGFEASVEFG